MKGIVFTGDRTLELMSFPDPSPGPGEVVLEMKASGMCGSDLKHYRRAKGSTQNSGIPAATRPVIAGHEPCGIVVAIGAGVATPSIREGARMMVHHYQGCTDCAHCRTGWAQLCQRQAIAVYGNNNDGGHAHFMKVPASTLVPLPEALSFTAGAAISCGTGTAYGALRRLNLSGRDTIAIFGQGPVGLSATQLAKAMGARVIALDINANRLAAASRFGADALVNPEEVDAVEAVRDLTHGIGADCTLDTSGNAVGRLAAMRCAKVWGTACFVGEGGDVSFDVSQVMLRKQLSVIGSWTFSTVGQAEAADFIVERGIAVDDLFTHRWTLDQGEEAYALFDRQADGKGVFLM